MTPAGRPQRRRASSSRLSTAQAWWPLLREIATCGLGVFILVWQTTLEQEPQAYLVAAGCALVGVPVVGALQRAVQKGDAE